MVCLAKLRKKSWSSVIIIFNFMKITKKQVFENLEEVENEEKVAIKIKNQIGRAHV